MIEGKRSVVVRYLYNRLLLYTKDQAGYIVPLIKTTLNELQMFDQADVTGTRRVSIEVSYRDSTWRFALHVCIKGLVKVPNYATQALQFNLTQTVKFECH